MFYNFYYKCRRCGETVINVMSCDFRYEHFVLKDFSGYLIDRHKNCQNTDIEGIMDLIGYKRKE